MQFHEFLNEFYQFGFSSNKVRLSTTRSMSYKKLGEIKTSEVSYLGTKII